MNARGKLADSERKGYLYAILASMCSGISPLFQLSSIRLEGITAPMGLLMRVCMTGLLLSIPTGRKFKKDPLPCTCCVDALIASLFMAVTTILLFDAYGRIPSGIASTLSYFYPALIVLARLLTRSERLGMPLLLAEGCSLLGIILICDTSILPTNPAGGIAAAFGSAIAFAGYLLWCESRKVGQIPPILFASLMTAGNIAVYAVYVLVPHQFSVQITRKALLFVGLAALSTPATYMLQAKALKCISAVRVSLLSVLEQVVFLGGSVLVFHDPFSLRVLIGAAFVLCSLVLITVQRNNAQSPHN